MSSVRVLVGTRKGAFVLTSDGKRKAWDISGPHFGGWEIYHVKGSPADPNRLYASQSTSWFGQLIQRSDDGGLTWEPVGNQFQYDGVTGTHQWYDGTPHPWEFARVWHLEPSLTDPDTILAGVEDAALFRSSDGGQNWHELAGLRGHGSGSSWQPGAGGMCLHTILLDPANAARMFVAISAAGVFRTDDGGQTWRPSNRGLHSEGIPDEDAEVGHCVHHLAMHPSRPEVLYMQKHWDVMRSDDGGDSWNEVSGDLPTDFGFAIDVHAHEPQTVYVVPIKSDSEHFPPDGKLRVYRSRTGGDEWEPLSGGLPQANCYVNVLRDAMAVDSLDSCGVYFGTTGGQVYVSADAGDNLGARSQGSARRALGRGPDVAMIRVVLPAHLRTLADVDREVEVEVIGQPTQRSVIDALEARYPALKGTLRDPATQRRRAFVRFFACEEDLSHELPGRAPSRRRCDRGRALLRDRCDGWRLTPRLGRQ